MPPMVFKIDIDPSRLVTKTLREQKRLAYAVAQSINSATKDIQLSERIDIDRKFQVRKAAFVYRLIKIQKFATVNKNVPYAELGIDSTKQRVLLSIFETGGVKDPAVGRNVAVPITGRPARPAFSDSVPEAFTFKGLGFKRAGLTKHGRDVINRAGKHSKNLKKIARKYMGRQQSIWKGDQRTFILPSTEHAPEGGVFQRVGKGRDDIRLIYSFRPHPRLKHVLKFVDTARAQFQARFQEHFDRNYPPEA